MTKLKKSLPYIALMLAIILQYYYAFHNPVKTYKVSINNKVVAETGNNG